jgi:hypothetical protein
VELPAGDRPDRVDRRISRTGNYGSVSRSNASLARLRVV